MIAFAAKTRKLSKTPDVIPAHAGIHSSNPAKPLNGSRDEPGMTERIRRKIH